MRAILTRFFSRYALTNMSILIACLIGGMGTIVFVPPHDGGSGRWFAWFGIVVGSQSAFALCVLVCRRFAKGPWSVSLILAAAGLIRGLCIAAGSIAIGEVELTPTVLLVRMLNSAIICVIGGGLIGGTLAWRADVQQQYQALLERATLLDRAYGSGRITGPALRAWSDIKGTLDQTLHQASERLSSGYSASDLTAAATLLRSEVETNLRPTSRSLWERGAAPVGSMSLLGTFRTAIGSWRLPLREILIFFAVVIGPGAMARVGVIPGFIFTAIYLTCTGVILATSGRLARAHPGRAPEVAVLTLVLLPVLVFAVSRLAASVVPGLETDPVSDLIVALQTPVSTILVAMAVEFVRARHAVLADMRRRVDGETVRLAELRSDPRSDTRRLSVFVHHHVQSEMSALAMQLREAALSSDAATREHARSVALERIARLEAIDAREPPWLAVRAGVDRINDVVAAWSGLLDVRLDLGDFAMGRPDQWVIAAQIVEDGLANAARHSDATTVAITADYRDDTLLLSIRDDGARAGGETPSPVGVAGVGLQVLDRVTPGSWSITHRPSGTTLTVQII